MKLECSAPCSQIFKKEKDPHYVRKNMQAANLKWEVCIVRRGLRDVQL